jgi:adenosylmethionine-8-amino-7-oxononanoate aminotransferase
MCGVELVEDKTSKELYPADWGVGAKMGKAMVSHGLFTRMRSEVVCIAPPLTTDQSTLDDIVSAVRDSIVDVFGE